MQEVKQHLLNGRTPTPELWVGAAACPDGHPGRLPAAIAQNIEHVAAFTAEQPSLLCQVQKPALELRP